MRDRPKKKVGGGARKKNELSMSHDFSLKHGLIRADPACRTIVISHGHSVLLSMIKILQRENSRAIWTLFHIQFVTHTLIDHRLSSHPHQTVYMLYWDHLHLCVYNLANSIKLHNTSLNKNQKFPVKKFTTVNRWTRSLLASSLGRTCWSWISSLMWL